MRRKLLLAALFVAASCALAAEPAACSCVEYGAPPCAAYWSADAVFTGVITDIKKQPEPPPGSLPIALLHFIVEDKFRGINVSEADVETLSGTSCDMAFEKGERWLVYGYRNEATGRLAIHPCTRTRRLGHGDNEDLAYARAVGRAAPQQSVGGAIGRRLTDEPQRVKVTVVGGGRTFETTTDDDGNFSVQLPKGGAYTVRAVIPFSAAVISHTTPVRELEVSDERTVVEYPVEVPAGRCAYNELNVYEVDLHATAEVSGKVLDEAGQPLTRGYVHLVEAAPKEGSEPWTNNARIGDDGSFKFERVPVGSFLLVLNPSDEAPDDSDAPHPRTFYPHAADRAQASPLVVTEGLKLEGVNFRVRAALRKRVIEGRVQWPDGKPAALASVSLYNGDKYVRTVKADARGRFEVEAYGDFDYQVSATVYGDRPAESEKVKVPRDGRPAPLVLKPKPE